MPNLTCWQAHIANNASAYLLASACGRLPSFLPPLAWMKRVVRDRGAGQLGCLASASTRNSSLGRTQSKCFFCVTGQDLRPMAARPAQVLGRWQHFGTRQTCGGLCSQNCLDNGGSYLLAALTVGHWACSCSCMCACASCTVQNVFTIQKSAPAPTN